MSTDIVLGNERKFENMLTALQDLRTTFLEGAYNVDGKLPAHQSRMHDDEQTPSQQPVFSASSRPHGFKEWPGDEKDLKQTLGLTKQLSTALWEVAPTLMGCLVQHLLSKTVVVKWDKKGKQGW
jgi:hypothetical protein